MRKNIDFFSIRGDSVEGQRSAFEQLVCHLARIETGNQKFRRIEGAGGDGGVEALHILQDGSKIGYQAKYYPNRNNIDWKNLDNSVSTALNQHPELKRYVIALPCDFTGKRAARAGTTEGIWGKWDEHVKHWEALAYKQRISVFFEPWTAFEIEAALLKPNAQHLIQYFFNQLIFNIQWFQDHLGHTILDLQARYSPAEHVNTESLKVFDVIFRRENICQDLQAIFDTANQSNPRLAASLVEESSVSEPDLVILENSRTEFLKLAKAIKGDIAREWPVSNWLTTWYSFTRQLQKVHDSLQSNICDDHQPNTGSRKEKLQVITKIYDLITPQVFGGPSWSQFLPIEGSRAVLIVGRAGAGKSHMLARGAEKASSWGAPVIHILGQHILDNDPRHSILSLLDLNGWTFHNFLSALNLAAESMGSRGLILIDALNEGNGINIWKNHLTSFVAEINKYDRLILMVSCREDYLEYVVPKEIIAEPLPYPDQNGNPPEDCRPVGKFVKIYIKGFETIEEREAAQIKFMDEKGISRPTVPVLDDEFFNPLFLSSVCRAMAKAGIKVFPRGLHGARNVFEFVLETKTKALGTVHDGTKKVHDSLLEALNKLAGFMAKAKSDFVPLQDAIDIIDTAFTSLPISNNRWLVVLENSDILRRDIAGIQNYDGLWSKPNEVIRFSFQRLQDNLIAEHLLASCKDICAAFKPGAEFAFLVNVFDGESGERIIEPSKHWVGVLGALWALVAEKHEIEIWNLLLSSQVEVTHCYYFSFFGVFKISIRERSLNAFSEETFNVLLKLKKNDHINKNLDEIFEILLSNACIPGHTWNADFLSNLLFSGTLADRDSLWSLFLRNYLSAPFSHVVKIINWALNVDIANADKELFRLAAVTLTWLLTPSSRRVRDRATKSLVNLMVGDLSLFPYLLDQFRAINDLYVMERLLTAGYGAICLDPSDERIKTSAKSVFDVIFGSVEPPVHLSVRNWSRLIIEQAVKRKLVPNDFNLDQISPPFGSAPPEFNINQKEMKEIAELAGGEAIANSCTCGDFYYYEIKSAVCHFSQIQDPETAGLWVARRAYQLGWTKQLIDRNNNENDKKANSNEERPIIERIGKKYQWIALEELLARLTDNYTIQDESKKRDNKGYYYRKDVWIRDRIDPTIFHSTKDNEIIDSSLYLGPPPLTFDEVEDIELEKWPFYTDLFDNLEPWFLGTFNNRRCLISSWKETINENHLNDISSNGLRRQSELSISLVAHKIGDRQKLINDFLNDNSHIIDSWGLERNTEGYLAHEFNLIGTEEIPIMETAIKFGTEIAKPILSVFLEENDDRSIMGNIKYIVPHPQIKKALGLNIPDISNSSLWLLPSGIVFLKKLSHPAGTLLLDKESFDTWCNSEGFEYSWVYISERAVWPNLNSMQSRWVLGVAWYHEGKYHFKNRQLDT